MPRRRTDIDEVEEIEAIEEEIEEETDGGSPFRDPAQVDPLETQALHDPDTRHNDAELVLPPDDEAFVLANAERLIREEDGFVHPLQRLSRERIPKLPVDDPQWHYFWARRTIANGEGKIVTDDANLMGMTQDPENPAVYVRYEQLPPTFKQSLAQLNRHGGFLVFSDLIAMRCLRSVYERRVADESRMADYLHSQLEDDITSRIGNDGLSEAVITRSRNMRSRPVRV